MATMDRKIIDFDQGWDFIQKGITKVKRILEGVQESHLSCEEYMLLYTTIFNMCTQKPPHDYSQQLYHKYKEAFDEYIKSTVLPSLNQKHDEFMLRELVQRWSNHKVMVRWLSHFFNYLDRFFLARRSLPGLNAVGLACFRDLVYMAVRANVRKAVISLIDKEREGEQIDKSLLKNVLDIFVEIGMGEMEQYEQDFEVQLLEDTANYYKSKATNWIEIYSCPDYMLKVEDCLRRERDRVSHYLHSSTEQKLVEKVRHELLVAHANFKFSLVDQVNRKMTQTKGTEHEFDAEENDWVFTNLIPLYELHDPRNGFIVNDTFVIEHSDNPDIARTDLAKAEEGFTGFDLDAELGYGGPQCCCMENQNTRNTMLENKFTWRIENFSKLNSKKLYSENFFIGGHSWRILIFPKGNNVDYLSIYLDAGDVAAGGNKFANFKLSLVDQFNCKMTQTKETEHEFDAEENDWGFTNFIPLYELHDYRNGFIVNDTCVIEAEISVPKSEHENQLDQAVSLQVCAGPIKHGDNPLPKEMSTTSFGELVDFRGLGKLEKALVPLLEEVCSQHPSLIDSQQRRSRRFVEWAFTALGRVLHFLKTKKVKDMNDEACNHLQILWEELETFKFDLTWLEPHFQSALGMKNYMERAVQVKKLKENVAALEMETKRLKARMAAIEVDLEIARTDLVKAKEGFTESHLDAELGYGGPQVSVTY